MKSIDPIFINTPTGTVSVFGHEHVSKKMLKVLGTILSHDAFETVYHGVKSVVFRSDGYPMKGDRTILASFSPDVGGISINLKETAERAIERSIEHKSTSVLASWWIEMVMNFAHETHHGVRWTTNRNELHTSDEKRMEEEERAEKYSEGLLVDLVKEYDIEPPKMSEEVWFDNHMKTFFGATEDNAWAKKQTSMLEDGQVWGYKTEDGRDIVVNSFKDLVCMLTDGNTESDEWNKPTIEVASDVLSLDEQVNGKKVTIDATGKMGEYVKEQLPKAVVVPVEDDIEFFEPYEAPFEEDTTVPVTVPTPQTDSFSAQKETPAPTQDMNEIARIAQQVYTKMYSHIFTQCGPLKDSDVGFTNPEAVCSTPITLTAEEAGLFTSMNHLDMNGRWCTDIPTTKGLFGKVMKNTKLPAYEVFLQLNGTTYKRMFIPQNPAKKNAAGQLTGRAIEARAGNSIAYVMDPNNNTANKWGPSIINGEYKLPRRN